MPNQPTPPLLEKDYIINLFKEAVTGVPIDVDTDCIRNYTMSFDKTGITLSVYFTDLKRPLDIRKIKEAKLLSIHYNKFDSSGGDGYEIIDIIGSTQGSINSEKHLGYALQFTLK